MASELHLKINVDGGSRGNPGPAGAGVVIRDASGAQILKEAGFFFGPATNNVAEYRGMLAAMELAIEMDATSIEILSDSELMVRQMTGEYRVKNEGLASLFEEAQHLRGKFKKFSIRHIPREQNAAADRLANQAMNLQRNVEDIEPPPEA